MRAMNFAASDSFVLRVPYSEMHVMLSLALIILDPEPRMTLRCQKHRVLFMVNNGLERSTCMHVIPPNEPLEFQDFKTEKFINDVMKTRNYSDLTKAAKDGPFI